MRTEVVKVSSYEQLVEDTAVMILTKLFKNSSLFDDFMYFNFTPPRIGGKQRRVCAFYKNDIVATCTMFSEVGWQLEINCSFMVSKEESDNLRSVFKDHGLPGFVRLREYEIDKEFKYNLQVLMNTETVQKTTDIKRFVNSVASAALALSISKAYPKKDVA